MLNISINNRPDLSSLFKSFIKRYNEEGDNRLQYYKKVFPFIDDSRYDIDEIEGLLYYYGFIDSSGNVIRTEADDFDDAEQIYPPGGKKKKRKKNKKKRRKYIDITTPYSGEEENPDEVDDVPIGQYIYFYPDYKNKNDRIEFTSLKAFDYFCEANDFNCSPEIGEKIAYGVVCHVCLNPRELLKEKNELMCEYSYADMYYNAR